jgi:demethylmenaquinone methyltransferase/2-methoxy-6-polyprenyl-1,4-benzoquinol methylase
MMDEARRDRIVDRLAPSGHILDLACGTGNWTRKLAPMASSLTGLDGAPEMIDRARRQVDEPVEFIVADVFAWQPSRRYDTVFFSSWLSHVPPELFAPFWALVRRALTSSGRALFIDERPAGAEAFNEVFIDDAPVPTVERTLRDGSRHGVVKVFYEPEELTDRLAREGWDAKVWPVEDVFFAGSAQPRS